MSSGKSNKCSIVSRKRGKPVGDITPKSLLAKKLQSICGSENFSIASSLLGVTATGARNYLDGTRAPTAAALSTLHATTRVDLNWLLDDSDERDGPVFARKKKRID